MDVTRWRKKAEDGSVWTVTVVKALVQILGPHTDKIIIIIINYL